MILAVESSCDETALAVVDETGKVRVNLCLSQIALHQKYGGVVPELASRSHFDALNEFTKLLESEKIFASDIRMVAATMGPGLVGPLLVGSSFARGLAAGWSKPFVGVHHLRAHVASSLLDDTLGERKTLVEKAQENFPALVLLVSGGHCMILKAQADLQCEILKSTSDDAAGECFDKCAKLIGLPYPGGPSVQAEAAKCQGADLDLAKEWAKKLPRPKSQEGFSFAGLKTAFRLLVEQDQRALKNIPALCRALEVTIADTLILVLDKVAQDEVLGRLVCCGGVSANTYLKSELQNWCNKKQWKFLSVPLKYATDNAVMIAAAAAVQAPSLAENNVFPRGALEKRPDKGSLEKK